MCKPAVHDILPLGPTTKDNLGEQCLLFCPNICGIRLNTTQQTTNLLIARLATAVFTAAELHTEYFPSLHDEIYATVSATNAATEPLEKNIINVKSSYLSP